MVVYAILIFVGFAVVGGATVLFVIQNQQPPEEDDARPRGFPSDKPE